MVGGPFGEQSVRIWTVIAGVCALLTLVITFFPRGENLSSNSPAASPTQSSASRSATTTPPVGGVEWTGSVLVTNLNGVDLNATPPYIEHHTAEAGVDLVYDRQRPELRFTAKAAIWKDAAVPSLQQCKTAIENIPEDRLKADGTVSIDVEKGIVMCAQAYNTDRHGWQYCLIRIVDASDYIKFDATRWTEISEADALEEGSGPGGWSVILWGLAALLAIGTLGVVAGAIESAGSILLAIFLSAAIAFVWIIWSAISWAMVLLAIPLAIGAFVLSIHIGMAQ